MAVTFGQFEAFIMGILPAHEPNDIEKVLRNPTDECAIIISDLKNNDVVGSDFIKDSGNPFPLRFKTLEEAQRALEYIIELHARTTNIDTYFHSEKNDI